ncbi:MAG: Ig-like domain-containing protein, partial [Deltaproteobacteria bacterium]|nr:Ig-like domain-containing protein [Deltaproteobacteria bacterium]
MADKEEKSADVPEELDRTRGGIKSLGREATKTEIRVDTGSHPAEKSGSPFSFLKNFLKKKPSPAKKEGGPPLASKPPPVFASANSRFAGIWLPASDMGSLTRIGFLVSRLVVAIAGVWLVYLLTVSFLRAFEESRTFPFVFAVTLGAALFLSIVSIPMRWSPAWFVGFPLLALLGLLGGQVFFYPTTDPSFFTFLGKAPAYIFNHVWIGVLAFELALILFVTPRARGLKGFFFVLAAYGLAGFIFNRLEGLALEAAWLGTGVFRGLPTIYLQPVFVAPTLFIPLFFIFSLGAFFLPSNFRTGRSTGWLGLNIPVLLFSAVLGWGVMQKNGVPTLLDFFLEERRGIGLTQTDVDGALLELKTTNFDVFRDKDTVERYRMELKKTGEHSRTSDESHYTLSVVNPDGFPVFFLDKSDFELSLDEKKITKWNLKTAPPEEEKPPLYLLSAILPPVMHDETAVKETSKTTTAPPSDTAVETPMEEGGSSQGLAHGLEFVRPTLGEYLPVETTVEVAVGESALFQTVTLYLGSEKLHEWGSAPYTFTWNTADLPSGKYVLKVKGATFEGVQASDSVPVFMGQARLKVIPPEGTATGKEGVFNYQDVVFVVDLSSSQWDSWGGKAKWEIQKAL